MGRTLNLLLFLFWIILGASCESKLDYSNTCLIPGITIDISKDLPHNKYEVLQCCPGYAGPITKCLPVCSECGPNAFCQAPEQCACIDDDYEKIENDKGCKPKLNRNLCVNTELAAENHWLPFSANNSQVVPKVCCEGYERLNESEPCLRKVDNHECLETIQVWDQLTMAPNEVSPITTTEIRRVCCKGYKRQRANGPCLPQSEPIETTSATTPEDPNLCTRELDTLRPVPPEWMSIKEAFDTFGITFPIDMFKEIETFCCPGYTKDESEQLCKPVCQPDCGPNSYCQAPNKCACHKGFTQSADSDLCVPECSEQTKPAHSTCLTPAIWACDEGYIKLPNKNGEKGYGCYPHCVHSCSSYGRCVAPNVCECLPGYTPIPIGHDAANDISLSICQKK